MRLSPGGARKPLVRWSDGPLLRWSAPAARGGDKTSRYILGRAMWAEDTSIKRSLCQSCSIVAANVPVDSAEIQPLTPFVVFSSGLARGAAVGFAASRGAVSIASCGVARRRASNDHGHLGKAVGAMKKARSWAEHFVCDIPSSCLRPTRDAWLMLRQPRSSDVASCCCKATDFQ